MAVEAMKPNATDTPEGILHLTEVSERYLDATNAD